MRLRPAVLAVALLQVGLPLALLGVRWADEGSRPRSELPASFQMYSSTARPAYLGRTADGTVRRLDAGSLPPFVRAVGTGRTVPDLLCRRSPDLVAVLRRGGPEPGEYPC